VFGGLDVDTTQEPSNVLNVAIEFETKNKGIFKFQQLAESEEEEDKPYQSLFPFDFSEQENGLIYSSGVWTWTGHPHHPHHNDKDVIHNEGESIYQFWVTGSDRFSITIQSATPTKEHEAVIYVGKRAPLLVEKSFFQKYGTMIIIAVIMLVQFFLKSKGPAGPAAPTQTQTQTASAPKQVKAKPQTPTTPKDDNKDKDKEKEKEKKPKEK